MEKTTRRVLRRTRGRRIAALIAVTTLVGLVFVAWSSVSRLLDPSELRACPAIWPPATSCVPGIHLVVVGAAAGVLIAAWLASDIVIRGRSALAPASLIVQLLVSLAAFTAAYVPQPFFVAWFELSG